MTMPDPLDPGEARVEEPNLPDVGRDIKPFTMLSSHEREFFVAAVTNVSGLRVDQIAVNSWGFPIIPLPHLISLNGRQRMAPKNVSNEWLMHPIFWIDPALTQFDASIETREAWSVRMFYLILGFGLWSSDLNWVNYPGSVEVWPTEGDIAAYHTDGNPPCPLDQVSILTESDLRIPLERVKEAYLISAADCSGRLSMELSEFVTRQQQAVTLAKSVFAIGNVLEEEYPYPESPTGFWTQRIAPLIAELDSQYKRALSGNHDTTTAIEYGYKLVASLENLITGMERSIVTLSVPVLRNSSTSADLYGQMVAYLGLASEASSQRIGDFNLSAVLEENLSRNDPGAGENVGQAVFDTYSKTWKRLRLALVNWERMRQETPLPPFTTYRDMDADHVGNRPSSFQNVDPWNMDELLGARPEDQFREGGNGNGYRIREN